MVALHCQHRKWRIRRSLSVHAQRDSPHDQQIASNQLVSRTGGRREKDAPVPPASRHMFVSARLLKPGPVESLPSRPKHTMPRHALVRRRLDKLCPFTKELSESLNSHIGSSGLTFEYFEAGKMDHPTGNQVLERKA
ncbi:hypothetical protein MTO96_005652 [Rhipicephalus appendiculatus]